MLAEPTYKTIVRTSAIYDLIVTAPFMTPWSLELTLDILRQLHTATGLRGTIPDFEPSHLLFAGLMGSIVVVWSIARLQLNLSVLGRYDALARMFFALWQVYAVASGVTPVILVFTAFEIIFGLAQALPHKGDNRALTAERSDCWSPRLACGRPHPHRNQHTRSLFGERRRLRLLPEKRNESHRLSSLRQSRCHRTRRGSQAGAEGQLSPNPHEALYS